MWSAVSIRVSMTVRRGGRKISAIGSMRLLRFLAAYAETVPCASGSQLEEFRRPGGYAVEVQIAPVLFSLLDLLIGPAFALPHYPLFEHRERRWDTPRRRRRGLALVLGGIEGPSLAQHAMATGLLRGRWRGAVQIQKWNGGVPIVRCALNLMSQRRHERTSDELVERVLEYRRDHAARPIVLMAVSGGCWVVVRALEKLGPDRMVDSAVLLAPAISPQCDLQAALAATCAGILSVRSPYDFALLGVGTLLLGTSDRRFGRAAGN